MKSSRLVSYQTKAGKQPRANSIRIRSCDRVQVDILRLVHVQLGLAGRFAWYQPVPESRFLSDRPTAILVSCYSWRSAMSGSIRLALRAGMKLANSATPANLPSDAGRERGSDSLTLRDPERLLESVSSTTFRPAFVQICEGLRRRCSYAAFRLSTARSTRRSQQAESASAAPTAQSGASSVDG
jgi:hypothetical protein